jgi:hypothetical protein
LETDKQIKADLTELSRLNAEVRRIFSL